MFSFTFWGISFTIIIHYLIVAFYVTSHKRRSQFPINCLNDDFYLLKDHILTCKLIFTLWYLFWSIISIISLPYLIFMQTWFYGYLLEIKVLCFECLPSTLCYFCIRNILSLLMQKGFMLFSKFSLHQSFCLKNYTLHHWLTTCFTLPLSF